MRCLNKDIRRKMNTLEKEEVCYDNACGRKSPFCAEKVRVRVMRDFNVGYSRLWPAIG